MADFTRKAQILDGMDSIVDSLRAEKLKGRLPKSPIDADVQIIKAKLPAEGITTPDEGMGDDLQAKGYDPYKGGVYTNQRGMPTPPPPPKKPTAALASDPAAMADAGADVERAKKLEQLKEILKNMGIDSTGIDDHQNPDDIERETLRRALEKAEG